MHKLQWQHIRDIHLNKVLQDDPIQEVYKDNLESYYATTKHSRLDMPTTQRVSLEHLDQIGYRLRDSWENDYRTRCWGEIRDLTWEEMPLF